MKVSQDGKSSSNLESYQFTRYQASKIRQMALSYAILNIMVYDIDIVIGTEYHSDGNELEGQKNENYH
jgi:hypothetical protein